MNIVDVFFRTSHGRLRRYVGEHITFNYHSIVSLMERFIYVSVYICVYIYIYIV